MLFVMILLTLSLAVGCRSAVSQQSGITTTNLQQVPPDKTPQPAPPAIPRTPGGADLGMHVKTQAGKVSVVLNTPGFKEGEVIRATLANGLPRTIYTADSKTDCSIAFLERWDGNAWRRVPGCALGRAPLLVAIGPGRGRIITINPFSPHLRLGMPSTSKPALEAGTYRIKFTYSLSRDPEGVEPHTSFSKAFLIRG